LDALRWNLGQDYRITSALEKAEPSRTPVNIQATDSLSVADRATFERRLLLHEAAVHCEKPSGGI
jgi:hypothetical protein